MRGPQHVLHDWPICRAWGVDRREGRAGGWESLDMACGLWRDTEMGREGSVVGRPCAAAELLAAWWWSHERW